MFGADVCRICHAVNQVFTHVSQWTDALTVSTGNLFCGHSIKIQHSDFVGIVRLILLQPGQVTAGAGGYIAVGTEIFRHGIDLSSIQSNAVNTSFYTQIKTISVGRNVGNRIYVFFQQLVILFGIHKQTFFHAGYRSVKIIQCHAGLSFVGSPVHVTANQEVHVSIFINIDNLDVILAVGVPHIRTTLLREAEHLRYSAGRAVKQPQSSI